jgi:hypothetical protein
MDLSNPYAPPQASIDEAAGAGSKTGWQLNGDILVAEKGAVLPGLCVWSGEPATHRVNRMLTWAPPWTAMMGVILILIFRKTGRLDFAVSELARKRKTSGVLMVVGSFLALVLCIAAGAATNAPAVFLVGILAFFVLLVVGLMRMQPFRLVKIDKTHIYIKLRPPAAAAFARVHG